MILLSASRAVINAYKMEPASTTPAIQSGDWFRRWRVDARKIGRKEVTFFTNEVTLYTIIIDTTKVREMHELFGCFMDRYYQLFQGRFGYHGHFKEEIVVHTPYDRSLIGVMNNFFQMVEYHEEDSAMSDLESWVNSIPVVARDIIPANCFAVHLGKAPQQGFDL